MRCSGIAAQFTSMNGRGVAWATAMNRARQQSFARTRLAKNQNGWEPVRSWSLQQAADGILSVTIPRLPQEAHRDASTAVIIAPLMLLDPAANGIGPDRAYAVRR